MTHLPQLARCAVMLVLGLGFANSAKAGINPFSPVLLRAENPAEVVARFTPAGTGWTGGANGFGGPGDGAWSYALAGKDSWRDYQLTCRFNLLKAADRQDGMEIGRFAVYESLKNLGGYEGGVVFRYVSPDRYYRIAVSSLWQELVLWRPSGGIVQVAPFPFAVGKAYELTVICRGPEITVRIDGRDLFTWRDTADPVLNGQAGLARKEGELRFTTATVTKMAPAKTTAAATRPLPRFREVTWHNLHWFFDDREPLFVLTNDNVLDNMKFLPGYRPLLYTFNHITDWNRFRPTVITESRVVESGSRLVLDTMARDNATKSAITCQTRLTVTMDPATGMYVYDQDCTVTLPPEECDKVSPEWDHGDAVFLGGVGSAQTRDPKAAKATYPWSVFLADDGKYYKVPMNHNGHFLGNSIMNGGPLKADGGQWLAVGDPVLSPVIVTRGLTDRFEHVWGGHCWWAYDMHTMFRVKKSNGAVQPGAYLTQVRYTGMRAAESNKLLAGAQFYKPADTTVTIPLYAAGLGFTERFDRTVVLATPHQDHRIWGGVIDAQTGVGDRSSLRLEGATEAWTITGPSYFMTGYAKRNLITAKVKTANVQGEGPAVGFRRWDNNQGWFYPFGVTGTKDWQDIAFVTEAPLDCFGVTLYFRNCGTGTAWIDDFKIEPLQDGAMPGATPGKLLPLTPPRDPNLVLFWNGQGDSRVVLDESGYGHHGRLWGDTAWGEENGRKIIKLDGKESYLWPLSSPQLTLGTPCTMVFDFKPETGGPLLLWGWNFNYYLSGAAPAFTLAYALHGGKMVQSQPFLTANEWQRLAIVIGTDQLKLYRNGKLVETLPATLKPGDWGLYTSSTWHRHLGFFGSGPANMTLTKDNANAGLKASLRSLRVYRTALSAQELAALEPAP